MSKRTEALFKRAYEASSPQEHRQLYREWASSYDADLEESGTVCHSILAAGLARLIGTEEPVLDVGCGTGLLGAALSEAGFGSLDGLDISPEMLDVARARGVYRSLAVADLSLPPPRPATPYGAAGATGVFTHGHLGPAHLPGLLEVLRPGGVLGCTVNQDVWHAQDYPAALQVLEADGRCAVLSSALDSYVAGHGIEARYLYLERSE